MTAALILQSQASMRATVASLRGSLVDTVDGFLWSTQSLAQTRDVAKNLLQRRSLSWRLLPQQRRPKLFEDVASLRDLRDVVTASFDDPSAIVNASVWRITATPSRDLGAGSGLGDSG